MQAQRQEVNSPPITYGIVICTPSAQTERLRALMCCFSNFSYATLQVICSSAAPKGELNASHQTKAGPASCATQHMQRSSRGCAPDRKHLRKVYFALPHICLLVILLIVWHGARPRAPALRSPGAARSGEEL